MWADLTEREEMRGVPTAFQRIYGTSTTYTRASHLIINTRCPLLSLPHSRSFQLPKFGFNATAAVNTAVLSPPSPSFGGESAWLDPSPLSPLFCHRLMDGTRLTCCTSTQTIAGTNCM